MTRLVLFLLFVTNLLLSEDTHTHTKKEKKSLADSFLDPMT